MVATKKSRARKTRARTSRVRAGRKAVKRMPRGTVSTRRLSRQAKQAAGERTREDRSKAARRAANTRKRLEEERRPDQDTIPGEVTPMSVDPVCGKEVAMDPGLKVVHEDHEYWFCSPECRDQFLTDPGQYVES